MKRIVFIGGLIDKENIKKFVSVSSCSSSLAQENYFLRLIDSLNKPGFKVSSISSPFLGRFSKQTSLKYNDCFDDKNDFFYGKCSTKTFSRLIQLEKSLLLAFNKLEKKESLKNDEIYLFVIQPNIFYLKAALKIQRRYKKSKIVVFVQDIPGYSHSERHSAFFEALKRIENHKVNKMINKANGFILFASKMKEKMFLVKPCIVVETVTPNNYKRPNFENRVPNTFAYTGSLNEIYGVKDMVDTFVELGMESTFYIAGDGDCREYIKSIDNPNIRFLGTLSNEECATLQSKVSVLINPRENKGDFTKYSFPSKTTEYLLNNGVVACFKLDGIPDEYDKILNYAYDNNFSALLLLAKKMSSISKDEFERRINFVEELLTKKTADMQAARIVNFLEEI